MVEHSIANRENAGVITLSVFWGIGKLVRFQLSVLQRVRLFVASV